MTTATNEKPGLIGADAEIDFSDAELGEMDAEIVGRDPGKRRRRAMVRVPVDEVPREASQPNGEGKVDGDGLIEQAFSGGTATGSISTGLGDMQKSLEAFASHITATDAPPPTRNAPEPEASMTMTAEPEQPILSPSPLPLPTRPSAVSALVRAATSGPIATGAAVTAAKRGDGAAAKSAGLAALISAAIPAPVVEVEPDSPTPTPSAPVDLVAGGRTEPSMPAAANDTSEQELDSDSLEETATPTPEVEADTEGTGEGVSEDSSPEMTIVAPADADAARREKQTPPPIMPAVSDRDRATAPRLPAFTPPPVPAPPKAPPVQAPPPPPAPSAAPSAVAADARQRSRRRRRDKQWFEEIFDDDYLRTQPRREPQHVEREVDFLSAALTRGSSEALLDLGCGDGRHAVQLATRGYSVTGFDLSLPLLIRAAEAARRGGVNVNFVHGDMREMSFDNEFDAAYSLQSSFGYFDDEANRHVLSSLGKALRVGGRLMLELVNRDYLVRELPTRVWWEGDGCMVLEEVDFNYFSSRLAVQRTVVFEDGRQLEQEISIRAYSLHEIGKLMHHCGFKVIEVSGSPAMRGHFFGADSRSLIVIAEKRPV